MPVKFFMFGDLGTHSPDDSEQAWDSAASLNTTDAMFAESMGKTLAFHVGDIRWSSILGIIHSRALRSHFISAT